MHDQDSIGTAALLVWWNTVAILGGVLFLAWGISTENQMPCSSLRWGLRCTYVFSPLRCRCCF
jgi:hypothetical protein